ncbi:hypothetical protein D9M69_664740 [compost metagenome]
MHAPVDMLRLDLGQRLQFALGDETPIRFHQHETPITLEAIEIDGDRFKRDRPAALQRVNVQSGHLHRKRSV